MLKYLLSMQDALMDRISEVFTKNYINAENIFDSILDGVIIADASKNFIVWNKSARDILESGPTLESSEKWHEHYSMFHIETGRYLSYVELPMIKALNGEVFYDYRIMVKTGMNPEGKIISVNGNPIRSGFATVAGITTFRDITNEVKKHNQIEAERKIMSQLLDLLPGIVLMKDLDGKYIYGNKGVNDFFHTDSIIGKNAEDFMDRKNAEELNKDTQLVINTGKPMTFHEVIYWNPKSKSNIEVIRFPFKDEEGNVKGICMVGRDITEETALKAKYEKEREEITEASKLAAIGFLATDIVNDIREPLSTLTNNCGHIKEFINTQTNIEKGIHELIDETQRTLEKLNEITRSLQDLGHRPAPDTSATFKFQDVLKDIIHLTQVRVDKMKIRLEIEEYDESIILKGSRIQMTEVILNLAIHSLDNIENTPNPSIKIRAIVKDKLLSIRIIHNGPPIPIENREQKQRPFFNQETHVSGTGLWLNISKRIVDQAGGELFYGPENSEHQFVLNLRIAD